MYSRLNAHEIVCCAFILSVSLYFLRKWCDFVDHLIHSTSHRTMTANFSHKLLFSWKTVGKFDLLKQLKESETFCMNENLPVNPITQQTGERTSSKKCVQFPSDWVPRVEMMKKFNLMFNSNSHPFFIFAFPVTVPKMVIRFSIYMITNISECDFYGVWGAFRRKKRERDETWVELNGILWFYLRQRKRRKRKFVTMKNLSIRDNCNPINSFPELLLYVAHEMGELDRNDEVEGQKSFSALIQMQSETAVSK